MCFFFDTVKTTLTSPPRPPPPTDSAYTCHARATPKPVACHHVRRRMTCLREHDGHLHLDGNFPLISPSFWGDWVNPTCSRGRCGAGKKRNEKKGGKKEEKGNTPIFLLLLDGQGTPAESLLAGAICSAGKAKFDKSTATLAITLTMKRE